MTILGFILLIPILCVAFFAPKRYAALALIAGVLFLPQGVAINIAGINVFALRFIETATFIRAIKNRELSSIGFNRIDRLLLILYPLSATIFVLRSSVDIVYQLGVAIDALLLYFSFRSLITTVKEFRQLLSDLVLILVPYAIAVLLEAITRINPFTYIDPGIFSDWTRNDRLRCTGSFRHPSLLGSFGATFVPLYIALYIDRTNRARAVVAIICCLILVVASNSGGPLNCLLFALVSYALWPLRKRMAMVRISLVVAITLLGFIMKAPIWYLPSKASAFSGGTGWHRSYLMEMAANHFDLWWFAGMDIKNTADWFPYQLLATGGADITNQYLVFGFTSGITSVILLLMLITRAYGAIGRHLATLESGAIIDLPKRHITWALGATLTAHIVNWLGIAYFDQSIAIWMLHLSAISAVTYYYSNPANRVEATSQAVSAEDLNRPKAQRRKPDTPVKIP